MQFHSLFDMMYEKPLTLEAPTPQNGQTYSNNLFELFDHFVGLARKGAL